MPKNSIKPKQSKQPKQPEDQYSLRNLQKCLAEGKPLTKYSNREIEYAMRSPIGKAVYRNSSKKVKFDEVPDEEPEEEEVDESESEEVEADEGEGQEDNEEPAPPESESESKEEEQLPLVTPRTKSNPKKKANWRDKVQCSVCGRTFMRCNSSRHNNSKYHKLHANVNHKFSNLLLGEETYETK